jgi:hypothetical protein
LKKGNMQQRMEANTVANLDKETHLVYGHGGIWKSGCALVAIWCALPYCTLKRLHASTTIKQHIVLLKNRANWYAAPFCTFF